MHGRKIVFLLFGKICLLFPDLAANLQTEHDYRANGSHAADGRIAVECAISNFISNSQQLRKNEPILY